MTDSFAQPFRAWTRLMLRLEHVQRFQVPYMKQQERRIRHAAKVPPSRLRNYPR